MEDATPIYGIEARASSVTRLSVHTLRAFNSQSPGRSLRRTDRDEGVVYVLAH
jgi:hypothetical protein